MEFELGFGNGTQKIAVPDENLADILYPNKLDKDITGEAEVRRALGTPIQSRLLREIVGPGEKIAIVTSDITRPMPTHKVMPPLLDELYAAGVNKEDITLVFALGSHRRHTEEEKKKLAGSRAYSEIRCIDGDYTDCIHIGVTSWGTPVDIVRVVAEADRRICLGNIEYHYFAGYSGGAKAVMPGVSTRAAIQANHSRMVQKEACAGRIEGNPVREDIEEAAAMVGVDFILNVVLDEHKEIIKAVAGDVTAAHREGCRFLDALYSIPIQERADIVVVSQGGAPKDINLYQTQKALDNAKHAVKKGGVIVLVGSCREGYGEAVFEGWISEADSASDLVERIERDFQLGGHKAAAIAMVLQDADIYLVSEMKDEKVKKAFLLPYPTAQEALDAAFAKLGNAARVLVMPYGGSTLPRETQDILCRKGQIVMNDDLKRKLETEALKIRIGIVRQMKARGFGHIGGCLSITDTLAVLYGAVMKVDVNDPVKPDRDKLICSKGHAGPAVYAALVDKGYFPKEDLETLNRPGTNLPSHCDRNKTRGVDMTTGSLGQGTSLACGIALGDKLHGYKDRVFLIVGDGELDEGQVWEAAMFAAAKQLDNMVWLIDVNKKQLDGPTDSVLPLFDIRAKFEAFGFNTLRVNGNDVEAVYESVIAKNVEGKPMAVILDTVKGCGVKEVAETAANHSMNMPTEKWNEWLEDLEAELAAREA